MDEILAKRAKTGKKAEEKTIEEKTTLHGKVACCSFKIWIWFDNDCPDPRGTTYAGLSQFLAHLSQRLICELIGFSWSGIPHRPSVVNNFKRLLLQNPLPDQSQILCEAALGRGN